MLIDFTKHTEIPDFTEWATNLAVKVFSDGEKDTDTTLNLQQKQLLKSLNENKFNIIKSPRQMGVTTLMLINTAYNMLYGKDEPCSADTCTGYKTQGCDDYSEMYVYSTNNSANSSFLYLKRILDLCDEPIFVIEERYNTIRVRFRERYSTIKFVQQERLRAGGLTVDAITVDNAAWASDEYMNMIPNYSKQFNCNVTIASTPKSDSGFFYELWDETLHGRGCFTPTALKWYLDDRFNKKLKATDGMVSYDVNNLGMMFEALEQGEYLTNEWYEDRKLVHPDWVKELDGDFDDRWKSR